MVHMLQAERVTQVEGASESGLAQQLDTVTQQVDQVKGENEELRAFFQEAMQVQLLACSPHACASSQPREPRCLQAACAPQLVVTLLHWYQDVTQLV